MMNYFAAEDAQKETEEEVFNAPEVFLERPITEQELQEAILNSFPKDQPENH